MVDRHPADAAMAERTADDAADAAAVQRAVERFVELCSDGSAPDLIAFATEHPPALRGAIEAHCRAFLDLDLVLGPAPRFRSRPDEVEPGAAGDGRRTFGDYVVQEELGRGGMGVVYLAHQRSLNRRVALKVLQGGLTASRRHVERFRREAEAAASVVHPAIVPVHTLLEIDGSFALAMDYVAGRNLGDVLDDLRLSHGDGDGPIEGTLGIAPDKGYVAECALFAARVASALSAAHQQGVVHRDLKPRNLMIDDRRQVRLLDFGLAKSLDPSGDGPRTVDVSVSGELTGTAHYLSPEQTLAKRVVVDHRADVWALGVVLYELLTLRRPFDGRNLQQIVYEICFKEPLPPQRLNTKVPRDLVTICLKALEKDPQRRYASAAAMEDDLQRFLRWEPILARPTGALGRAAKFVRRHRLPVFALAVLLLTLTIVLVALWQRAHVDAQRADSLLLAAERRAGGGDFVGAIELARQALELRNDEPTRARHELLHEKRRRTETEAAWKVARTKQLLEHDRDAALALALEAEAQTSTPETRSAVLDALGSGYAVETLPARRVLAAAAAPDRAAIVTADADGRLLAWAADRVPTEREPPQREPTVLHAATTGAPMLAVAFAGDDRLLAAGADRTLRCFDERGVLQYTAPLHGSATALRVAAAAERALVAVADPQHHRGALQVFSTRDGRALGPPIEHAGLVLATALSPCGRFAASTSGLRSPLRLWRTDDQASLASIDAHLPATLRVLEYSPDGAVLAAAADDGAVRLHAADDGRLLGTLRHPRAVVALAFDPVGERLLTGSRDATARTWQLDRRADGSIEPRELSVLVGHEGPVQCVAFAPNGQLALTGAAAPDGALRIFDVGGGRTPDGEAIRRYEVGQSIDMATFDARGERVLAVAGQRALSWEIGRSFGVVTLRQPGAVPAVAFDGSQQRVVTAGDDERLRLWSTRDGRNEWTSGERLGNPVRTLDVDASGDRIACSTTDGAVSVRRLRDGGLLYLLDAHRGSVAVVRFVADDRLLTAGSAGEGAAGEGRVGAGRNESDASQGLVVLWNTNDQSPLARLERPRPVIAADVDRAGKRLATIEAGEGNVRLWSLPELHPAGEVRREPATLQWVRFAPDGRLLLAGDDGLVRLAAVDGRPGDTTFAVGEPVRHATLSPDGRLLLTAGTRRAEAQLWRTDDGSEVLRFHGHRASVAWAAFSPDGAWAATSARDGTTCIWPTDPVAVARRLGR